VAFGADCRRRRAIPHDGGEVDGEHVADVAVAVAGAEIVGIADKRDEAAVGADGWTGAVTVAQLAVDTDRYGRRQVRLRVIDVDLRKAAWGPCVVDYEAAVAAHVGIGEAVDSDLGNRGGGAAQAV